MVAVTSKKHGFTLIELVVVILIISILAVTVGPKIIGVDGFNSYVYRDQMISSLRLTQQQAMQQTNAAGCHQVIVNNKGYGRSVDCDNPSLVDDWQNNYTGFQIPVDQSVSIQFSGNTLTFDSWGRVAECSSGCSVDFISDETATLCIESQGYIHDCL